MHIGEQGFVPVILGGDITAYSLARSFHEAYGIQSVAISTVSTRMCDGSSIIENITIPSMDSKESFVSRLIGIAAKYPNKQRILLACGDWYVRLVVENKEALSVHYLIPYIDRDMLDRLVLKDSFYEICEELNVPYPRTYVYDCGAPPQSIKLPFKYPIIAKPASSAEYHYADFPGKKKVFKFDSPEQLYAMLESAKSSGYAYKFLLQDYIPGDDTNMRILTCYCDRHAKVRFMAFGQTLLEDKGDMGIGNPVAIVNRVELKVMEQAKRLLEAVGYTGFANFDIKYDSRDKSYRFFEINTRLGRSNYYVTASGFNVVTWIIDDLVFQEDFSEDVVIADNEDSLYTVVPKSVLDAYVTNEDLRCEIARLYAKGKACNPISYKAERSFIRRVVYPQVFLAKQARRFKGKPML